MHVQAFTEGRTPDCNEDAYGSNDTSFVMADGSTDKSGQRYGTKTGGEILAQLIVEEALKTDLNGSKLVAHLSEKVRKLYKDVNPGAITDPNLRFASTLLCGRIEEDTLIITQLYDTSFRINGQDLYESNALVNDLNSAVRAHYIRSTGDVPGSREYILPLLKAQVNYRNNAESPAGYGEIDGFEVPDRYIKVYRFPIKDIHMIEVFTDGYYAAPKVAEIEAYEELAEKVEREDPYKCRTYMGTKSRDDRTVMIITL